MRRIIYRALLHIIIFTVLLLSAAASLADTIHYTYDDLNRLIRAEYDDGTIIEYEYDKIGNRLRKSITFWHNLTLIKAGSGIGDVTSSPAGIQCGTLCSGQFNEGDSITLTATEGLNSTFAGWSAGGCNGTGPCLITLGANTTITATFNVKPPIADFSGSPVTGVATITVYFTDLSLQNPTSWSWNFGDGTSSTLKNPSHTYSGAGNYTVNLTATNAGGSNTKTKEAYIVVQPYVKIAGSPVIYRNIQEAYNAAANGATIQVRGLTLNENFNANSSTGKNVTLEGGYDANFTTASGVTILKGAITTTTGILTVKNFNLQK